MAARNYSSTAEAKTLSVGINSSVTSMTLNSVTTLPASYPYTLVIDPDTSYEEIVTVSSIASGVLTIVRGQDGTSAQSHNAGAVIRHMITARDLQEPQNHINASTSVHGITGAVVGTTDTQILSAKTLSSPTITGTITGAVVTSANISGTIIDTKLATISTAGKVSNSATTATDANTASAIVARDASGNFTAGTIAANLTGNASGSAASLATARTINGISFNGTANIKTHVGGQGSTSATTYDRITHGLGTTPSSYSITLRSNTTTSSVRSFYITNVNTTFFDVYANDASGNQVSAAYYWIAIA